MIDNRTVYRDYPLPNEANKMRTEDLPRFIEALETIDDEINTIFSTFATASYVDDAVAALIGDAGAALDTLGELADALADDANYAATITTTLSGKQAAHANLDDISGLTFATGKVIYGTGAGTIDLADSTSYGRSIWNVANEAAFKSLVNLENADILSAVLASDGSGSTLDADLLRGTTPSVFGLSLLDDANAAAGLATLGALAASSYTAADVLSKILTVDGAGSLLDADLWDGNNFATYLNQALLTSSSPSFAALTITSALNLQSWTSSNTDIDTLIPGTSAGALIQGPSNSHVVVGIRGNDSNDGFYVIDTNNGGAVSYAQVLLALTNNNFQYKGGTVWTAANDGSGSTLDADTLRGTTPTAFGLSLLDDANAAAGLTTLGVSAFMQTLLDDVDQAAAATTLGLLSAATYTAADVLAKLLTVDGSGSLLDADLLDGLNSSAFVQTTGDQSIAGTKYFTGLPIIQAVSPTIAFDETDATTNERLWDHSINGGVYSLRVVNDAYSVGNQIFSIDRTAHTAATFNFGSIVTLQHNGNTIWHAGIKTKEGLQDDWGDEIWPDVTWIDYTYVVGDFYHRIVP